MTEREITIDVRGLPRPQGSLKLHALPNGGTAARYPAAVWAWRAQVQQAVAERYGGDALEGPVSLHLGFDLPRPRNHFGTGRNANTLKASSPQWPITIPDLDKLTRCIADACTDAGVWRSDAQVVVIRAAKRYCVGNHPPGVFIRIIALSDLEQLRPSPFATTA